MLINQDGKLLNDNDLKAYDAIIFYGASTRNARIIDKLGIRDRVQYVVDSNAKREGEYIDGFKIYSIDVLESEKKKNILILTVLEKYAEDIMKTLKPYTNCELAFYLPGKCNLERVKKENETVMKCITYKKYINVFPDEKFLYPYYTMLEECFNIDEHLFIIDYDRIDVMENEYQNLEYAYEKNIAHKNILIMKDFGHFQNIINEKNCNDVFSMTEIDSLFDDVEKIVLHSISFSENFLKFIQTMIKKGYGKKVIWISWGGDVHFQRDSFAAMEILQKIKCGYASENNIEKISKFCDINIIGKNVAGYNYIPRQNLVSIKEKESISSDRCLNVLLGHFASELNNLEFGLDILYKFRNENIKIYCTLSYGVESYRKRIIEKGEKMFGNKFVPVINYMRLEQYYIFLNSIDIILFPMVRLAGVTTLCYLSLLRKRIYMLKERKTELLKFDIHIEDIEKIKEETWEEFVDSAVVVDEKKETVQEWNNKCVALWQEILA